MHSPSFPSCSRAFAPSCLILICLCSSVFADPKLLLDRTDINELNQKIAGSFANQWKDFRAEVDRTMTHPIELPPRGGNWSHNYVCPEHGARLKQGKQIGPWQWEHICPVGPHVLHGDLSKATTDFDGNGIMGVHLDYAEELVRLGVVYQITHDPKYAQRSREILIAYADKYENYPLHDNHGKPGAGGHVASQSLTEASWLILVTQGADLVWDTLSPADRQTIEEHLLRPALTEVILPHNLGIHNIQCRHNSAIGLVGFLLDDKSLIAKAIDDPKSGFRAQIAKGVRDDGMWLEGASGYHFFTIDGLIPLAEAARHAGIDLYSPRFKSMFDGPLNLVMPDLRLPNFNDSGIVDLRTREDSYELAYARWRDDKYLPLIDTKTRNGRLALLYGVSSLPADAGSEGTPEDPDHRRASANESGSWRVRSDTGVRAEKSRNLTSSGFAILEKHADSDATWLCLKYGPHGGGHGHFDKNHFILWHNGAIVMPDAGTHAYGSPLHSSWDKTTLAHNTLIVDETSQLPAEGKCLAFGASDGIDFAVTDAGDAFKSSGVRFVRAVAMIDPKLIVVIDRVESDREHTYDIAVHLSGKWNDLPSGETRSFPEIPGYSQLQDITSRDSRGTTTFQTALPRSRTARATVLADEPTELITATGVGDSTSDRVPVVLLRRHAKSTTFVWTISLDDPAPSLAVSGNSVTITRPDATLDLVLDPSSRTPLLVRKRGR